MNSLRGRKNIKILVAAIFIFLCVVSCINVTIQPPGQNLPSSPKPENNPSISQPPHPVETPPARRMNTPLYTGGSAIIFRLDDVVKGLNEDAVDKIIRIFGKNNVPLDVGIVPHSDGVDSYAIPFLKAYFDNGIIDLTVHGNQHTIMEFDTGRSGISYEKLKSDLEKARQQFKQFYGIAPVSFSVAYDYFNEVGYKAVQDAGFKIFSTQKSLEPYPSTKPVDYFGKPAINGMVRLGTISDVAKWDTEKQQWGDLFQTDPQSELFSVINSELIKNQVAVVGIHAQAFLDASKKIDDTKLNKLDSIIKLSKNMGTITTFLAWNNFYADITYLQQRKNKTPAFTGGPSVIFRMDDAQRNVNEQAVEQIIKVFEQNKVPVDVGVMPFGAGETTYNIPFLLKYLDAGVIDISTHGYIDTFLEFDTVLSGTAIKDLREDLKGCFQDTYGGSAYQPARTTYDGLKAGLLKSNMQFKNYFGFVPVAFTVPYDVFNEDGYKAVQEAGFKIFSSILEEDPYPSAVYRVDYSGRISPNGMYRLPSTGDVAEWDSPNCQWGDILTLSGPADPLYSTMQDGLRAINIAIVRIHPQAFVDSAGNVDTRKLTKLDAIIKYVIANKALFGSIITFQSWYEYTSVQKSDQ
jgi:hypothetical protein